MVMRMSGLVVVVGFDNTREADRPLIEVVRPTKENLVNLEDAVVAIRSPDETVRIKHAVDPVDPVGMGAARGGLSGALWGTLVGSLFPDPLLGFAAGAAVGAGSGALAGSLSDDGVDDDLLRSIGDTLQPNTSTLFVLVRKAQPEEVLADIQAALSQARPQDEGAAAPPPLGATPAAAGLACNP